MQPDLDAAPDRGADRKLTQPLGRAVKFTLVFLALLLFVALLVSFLPGKSPTKTQLFGCVRLNGIAVTATAVSHLGPGRPPARTRFSCAPAIPPWASGCWCS